MNREPGAVRQNVFYSLFDYLSQPAMMIVAAPLLLKTLGVAQYGTWMLVNSIAATASGLGGGFGDGATKFVSMYRGRDDGNGVLRSVAAALAINVVLGSLLVLIIVVSAPMLIDRMFHVEPALRQQGIVALRVSAFVLLIRFAEAVFISAIRGYERYRPVVLTSTSSRTAIVLCAILLAANGQGLVGILWATLAVEIFTVIVLAVLANGILPTGDLRIADLRATLQELLAFGSFTWLKSVMGVFFGYADRLMVAALLGTGPLAFYVLCNQLTQPIQAVSASGFNFLFPNISARCGSGKREESERIYRTAVLIGVCVTAAICLPIAMAARIIPTLWLGAAAAPDCRGLLITMTIGNGLLAICIVPHYAALALGQSRALAIMNAVAGIVSIAGVYLTLRYVGLVGGGFGKILAGLVSLSAFAIAHTGFRHLAYSSHTSSQKVVPAARLGPAM